MSFLSKIFNRGRTQPDDPQRSIIGWYPQRYVPLDLQLAPDEQLSLSAIWACVSVISTDVASCEWQVYMRKDNQREALPDDDLAWILNNQPNPETIAQSLKEGLMFQAMMHGNAYAEIVRDQAGRVRELWLLRSDRVQPWRNESGEQVFIVTQQDGQRVVLKSSDVFHLRGPSIWGTFGESVMSRAGKAAAVSAAQERFSLSYFSNNIQPGVIVKVPRNLKPEEETALQSSWKASKGGVGNACSPIVVPPGIDVVPFDTKARDAQLIEGQNFSVEQILRFFRVPGFKVGVTISSQGYGRNLNELSIEYVRGALRPWVRRIEQECNVKLIPYRAPKYVHVDLRELTRGDDTDRAAAAKNWIDGGIKSVNEVREEEGLDALEGEEFELPRTAKSASPESPSEPTEEQDHGDQGAMEHKGSEQDVGDRSKDVAAMAIKAMLRGALEKHRTRSQAREADLRRVHTNGVLADKLQLARQELRDRALKDLRTADDVIRATAKHAVDLEQHYQAALVATEQGGNLAEITDAVLVAALGGRS